MKKIIVITVIVFLFFNKSFGKELKNPGDIMVDFESFSPANCDFQCYEIIDSNYQWPEFPEIFSEKWLDEKLLRQGKKYSDMVDSIYDTPKLISSIARACLTGDSKACVKIIDSVETVVKKDLFI